MTLSEPQIAGIIVKVNSGEVDAGEVARSRASMGPVRAYAMRMIAEHTAANVRLGTLLDRLGIAPADSAVRQQVSMQGFTMVEMPDSKAALSARIASGLTPRARA